MGKPIKTISKILLTAGVAWIGHMAIGGVLIAVLKPGFPPGPEGAEVLVPMALGQLLTVCALWWPARASSLTGNQLFLALFSAIFGVGVFLVQVEAAVFLVMEPRQLAFSIGLGTLQALWLAVLMTMVASGSDAQMHERPQGSRRPRFDKRLMLTSGIYLFLYFTAGMMIYAHIADYYAQQHIPPLSALVPLQLVRGALYVVFVHALLSSLTLTRWQAAWATGFMFPMLAGVAALMAPNALMPDAVRHWHMLEIGVSNLIFGLWVGYTFAPGADPTRRAVPLSTEAPGHRAERAA